MWKWIRNLSSPSFETERLYLRQIRLNDYKALHELYSDSKYLTYFGMPSVKTLKDTRDMLKLWINRLDPDGFQRWSIVLKSENKVIGTIGLHSFLVSYKKAAVGYDLNPKYQKKGYMQEALQAILQHFFEDLGYHRLEAIIVDENVASLQVVEKAGFVKEGLMRQWMHNATSNTYYDAYLYGLLESDYIWGSHDLQN